MDLNFLLFVLVGFFAQLVDGALGMAYGVSASTVLLGFGVPPAVASACVHAAEIFTTGASASSHALHRNVDWRMFTPLTIAGVIGGAAGAWLLVSVDGHAIRPFVTGYLVIMGLVVLWRAIKFPPIRPLNPKWAPPLGFIGGALDAVGGGGWGPTVTSTLMGVGGVPRQVIGTVNCAEFAVTLAISTTFLIAILTGRWNEHANLLDNARAVAGLIIGGVVAAPLAGFVVRLAPPRALMTGVGVLIVGLAGFQTWQLAFG